MPAPIECRVGQTFVLLVSERAKGKAPREQVVSESGRVGSERALKELTCKEREAGCKTARVGERPWSVKAHRSPQGEAAAASPSKWPADRQCRDLPASQKRVGCHRTGRHRAEGIDEVGEASLEGEDTALRTPEGVQQAARRASSESAQRE